MLSILHKEKGKITGKDARATEKSEDARYKEQSEVFEQADAAGRGGLFLYCGAVVSVCSNRLGRC